MHIPCRCLKIVFVLCTSTFYVYIGLHLYSSIQTKDEQTSLSLLFASKKHIWDMSLTDVTYFRNKMNLNHYNEYTMCCELCWLSDIFLWNLATCLLYVDPCFGKSTLHSLTKFLKTHRIYSQSMNKQNVSKVTLIPTRNNCPLCRILMCSVCFSVISSFEDDGIYWLCYKKDSRCYPWKALPL